MFTAQKSSCPLSHQLSEEIEKVIPGGVNSPFRSFEEVGGHTIFFDKARGAYLFDIDGNRYIDYLGAWGPAILGHCPEKVIEACSAALAKGPVFGSPHAFELEFARKVIAAVPSLEMVRFVNSGTEAVMSCVRLARHCSGKDLIVMIEGGYHGHSDSVLASAHGHRTSGGIPGGTAANTVLVRFNDLESMKQCLESNRGKAAAVLIEPVPGSMGVIAPAPGYLQGVRELCDQHECLLVFDEVLTGFRIAYGGAQSHFGVRPDLSCFGKGLGGGMPIGAYGGRRAIMENLQPIGSVYQAGTFSGNPVTMAGGIAILDLLSDSNVYQILEDRTSQLFELLSVEITKHAWPIQLQRVGSMFAILFCDKPVRNFEDSKRIDVKAFAKFFHRILADGVYLPPSSVDAACVSAAHTSQDIETTAQIMLTAIKSIF